MRKTLTTVLVALLLMSADLVWSSSAQADVQPILPTTFGEAIIGFEPGFLPNLGVGNLLKGLPITHVSENGSFMAVKVPNLQIVRTLLSAIPGVKYVEDNLVMQATAANDPYLVSNQEYGAGMMGFPAAWAGIGGYGDANNVTIALIDSGVLATHPDLAGPRLLPGHDYIKNDNVPDDTCGHGTHTAGIAGATTNNGIGVAGMSQAKILPMKALAKSSTFFGGTSCSGSYTQIAQAIMDAADYGVAHNSRTVISMSIGGPADTTLENAVNYAYGKGAILVAAAGNDGGSNSIDYPGAYPNVIAVGALTSSKARVSYSDGGSQLDIMAPGSGIYSTYNNGGYASLDGTSMATPHVAGALALALSCNPTISKVDLVNDLYLTAEPLPGSTSTVGHGLARADNLVAMACTNYVPPPNLAPTASFTTAAANGLGVNVNGSTSTDPENDPLTYSWNWGDGSPVTAPSSTPTASHIYADTTQRTITLTVADDHGHTAATGAEFTPIALSDPDPSVTNVLSSGVAVNVPIDGGTHSETYYKIVVPPGATKLVVALTGPACGLFSCAVDGDLFTQYNSKPTNQAFACHPNLKGNAETCTTTPPQSGYWFVRIHRRTGAGNVTLKATLN